MITNSRVNECCFNVGDQWQEQDTTGDTCIVCRERARERDRQTDREGGREKERERERERENKGWGIEWEML